jgi:hypothetical protein
MMMWERSPKAAGLPASSNWARAFAMNLAMDSAGAIQAR